MKERRVNQELQLTDFPHLFKEELWPGGPLQVRFELRETPPLANLIANVNIVSRVGDTWLIIKLADGSWEIPGGTLEPGESYFGAARRELLEEAGARLVSFRLFGAWHCTSLAAQPYRPHLPFPEFYRVVGMGEIELVQQPENPVDGEPVVQVELVAIETAIKRFAAMGRLDLAELYRLAAMIIAPQNRGDST
jgi:8-oxo-dGTP diphosphatase